MAVVAVAAASLIGASAALLVGGGVGPAAGLAVLWVLWVAGMVLALVPARPSLALAGVQAWWLLNVVAPATIAVGEGRVLIAAYDVTAGASAALGLAAVAQVALLAGALVARAVVRDGERVVDREAWQAGLGLRRRLDRLAGGLLAAGVIAKLAFVAAVGGSIELLNVLVGPHRYRALARATEGAAAPEFLAALGALAGAAVVVAALRLVLDRRSPVVPVAVLCAGALLLVMGGNRAALAVPAVTAALLWLRWSRGRAATRPRVVFAAGVAVLFVFAAVVGGLRDQEVKLLDPVAFAADELRGGVFANLAALADHVPDRRDHIWGASYAELLAMPVPRVLWPDKPEGAIKDVQRDYFPSDIGASFAAPGEAYLNFGLIGVVAVCALFGLLVEGAWRVLRRSRDLATSVLAAAAIAVGIQWFSRGYLAGQVAGQLGFLIGLAVVVHSLRRPPRDASRAVEPAGQLAMSGRVGSDPR